MAVLGANGAGKTTLLNAIAGVIDPAKGSIEFEGRRIDGRDADVVARAGVVLVPEGRQVFTFLSVLENLRMGAFARRRDPEAKRDLERVFEWFPRLRERQGQAAGLLSGGEQQMVAIGRAFMGRPRLLLLDEPSLGLAPTIVEQMFGIIRAIHAEGVAILLVEQNVPQALDIADRAYVLEEGRVVADGAPSILRQQSHIQQAYLGFRDEADVNRQRGA